MARPSRLTDAEEAQPADDTESAAPIDFITPIEQMAAAFSHLPDQVLAAWLQPFFYDLYPLPEHIEIPDRIATLARLAGVELRPAVAVP